MKRFLLLFTVLVGGVFFSVNADAWTAVKLKHNINGVTWGASDRNFTQTDSYGNEWKLEIDCNNENITGDFYFRIWVSDNNQEWEPYTSNYPLNNAEVYGARKNTGSNYSFKISQSSFRYGKITIYASYIDDSKWNISFGGEGWLPTENPISIYNSASDDYYFVSPELTNSECWEGFRLSPSRPRYGNSEYSGRFFTFHLQDFTLGNKSSITWWIQQKSTGKKFYPGNDGDTYELGSYDFNEANQGSNVRYQNYGSTVTTGSVPKKFLHTKNYEGCQSMTVFFDDTADGDGKYLVSALLNKSFCGTSGDAGGYYLIGNYSNTAHNLDPQASSDRKLMHRYYYKNGLQYTSYQANPDSVVYRVTVNQPDGGWASLYMLIFDKETIESWPGDEAGYKKAIRPQTQWNYTLGDPSAYDPGDPHHPRYEGMDATAIRGGLFTGRSDAGDIRMALNPKMDNTYKSYTFSMNITTSTYTITLNKNLYIMGPAVDGTEGIGDRTAEAAAAWSSDSPEAETAHAKALVFDPTDNSYFYGGGIGATKSSPEQTIRLVNGQRFAFVWDKDFSGAFYAEDDVEPVDLSTSALLKSNYGKADNDKGNYDTQYVNFQSIYQLEKSTFDPRTDYDSGADQLLVDGSRFNLPTGDYYIRLYITELDGQQYVYYVIKDRNFAFKKVPNAVDDDGIATKAIRTFSDYHAVKLATGVKAYTINSYKANPNVGEGAAYLQQLTLTNQILPGNTPVILVADNEGSDFITYYGANPKVAPSGNVGIYMKSAVVANTTIAAHEGTDYDNFVLGYKDLGDGKNTIGFYHPSAGYVANINSAYLQLPYNYLGDAGTGMSFVLRLDGDQLTGISTLPAADGTGKQANGVYTLDGRKVSDNALQIQDGSLAKGVYVVNGKKVVIK